MKKTLFYAFILVVILSGCTKLKNIANISVDIPYSQEVSVPQVNGYDQQVTLPGNGVTLAFPAVAVATNSQAYIAQYGTAVNKILDVYLKSLSLQVLSPAGQNFNFLTNVQVYISSKTQPQVLIAYQNNIPKGETTLALTTDTTLNLKNYFVEDTIYFMMNTRLNATPFTGTQLNIASVFHLLANPLD